ncbi:MAG TPA: hypothetical protein VGX25_11915 [Actinophytocola sp.]|uniref:hypothetical protein n=1 Tax=Actinophytocola sp. TaxID=1872138 RepID=UPI002DDD4D98|nr:hypothetical protein [Actinophytocola sp.]HEV2780090.1 hypothetical protein [Actinophytocola sp.]
MDAKLFTLVNAENDNEIFAWGMEISDETRTEAVLYRWDPQIGQAATGLHRSAEAARALWDRIAPMELRWEMTAEDVLKMVDNLSPCSGASPEP